ncbi:MAG: hypothetical protein ACP5OH_04830 [Nitrososphaerota archaeon]
MVTSNKTIIWIGSIGHIGFGASSKIHQVFYANINIVKRRLRK